MADELSQYYNEFVRGCGWVRADKDECGCQGSGWFLSQVDTWHRCTLHGTKENSRHPEDYDEQDIPNLNQCDFDDQEDKS